MRFTTQGMAAGEPGVGGPGAPGAEMEKEKEGAPGAARLTEGLRFGPALPRPAGPWTACAKAGPAKRQREEFGFGLFSLGVDEDESPARKVDGEEDGNLREDDGPACRDVEVVGGGEADDD